MKTLSEILDRLEIKTALNEKFPGMSAFAGEVEVIPWQDDFNVADKNPEVIETIEFLDMLLKNSMITEEQYKEQSRKISTSYSSKTMGLAWIDTKKVSFRDAVPKPYIVLHELGHIYFQANDILWNSSYGGGEILLWLALEDRYDITEGHIRRFHGLIEQIYEDPEGVHEIITGAIAPKLDVYPHLFPVCLFAGYMPEFDYKDAHDFFDDLKSPKWADIPVEQRQLFTFFQNLTDGLKYNDSFWVSFAGWLGIINKSCGRRDACPA